MCNIYEVKIMSIFYPNRPLWVVQGGTNEYYNHYPVELLALYSNGDIKPVIKIHGTFIQAYENLANVVGISAHNELEKYPKSPVQRQGEA